MVKYNISEILKIFIINYVYLNTLYLLFSAILYCIKNGAMITHSLFGNGALYQRKAVYNFI